MAEKKKKKIILVVAEAGCVCVLWANDMVDLPVDTFLWLTVRIVTLYIQIVLQLDRNSEEIFLFVVLNG